MDPNATLTTIRKLVAQFEYGGEGLEPDDIIDLTEAVDALDKWLSKGGFPPEAWRHAR